MPRTLASLKAQTRQPDEVIVASDASTDTTVAIASDWGATVLDLPKGNGSVARNRAADASTGNYLFLLDADDEWHPTKVERHLAEWAAHPVASFLLDPSTRIRPNGERRGANGAGPAEPLPWQAMVEHRNWSSGSGLSIRRDAWFAVSGFNEKLPGLQDVEFLIRLAHVAGPGWRIPDSLTDYYLHAGGVSRTVSWTEQLLGILQESLPFLEAAHLKSLRRTMALRNALGAPFPACLPHFAQAGWPLGDQRFWKYLVLTILARLKKG